MPIGYTLFVTVGVLSGKYLWGGDGGVWVETGISTYMY